ncbi:Structural maintenance of chromosomes protein 2 [Grifola frondosa]|uniref:Structural maintenance of chromosomes protein 2 n=1 Tax=Grifola frondosa TaxID=5627 RepID=A0A1C7M919_GRIFR|nr:Structural maintenance of chromosomes protein 2 [Grifola frondosa]
MSSMRAQNQQDLIYKRGQAGYTKASVTIVFDNSDRSTSPVGLENCKQITVTRQIALPNVSKYILNGHKSQQHTIQTLFQGVQLNINNPNFLIMQGRITKVLNMRPQEILGMVEEAAGTRMFEERKDKAKKTMGKKDKRVQEITSLLTEEITPKLDTLRAEKRSFLQWQKACTELERIGRVLRAWEWMEGRERVAKKEDEIGAKEKEIIKIRKGKEKYTKEIDAAEKQAEDVHAQRDKELKKGGKFKKLEDEVGELGKVLVKIRTQVEIKNGTIADEEGKADEVAKGPRRAQKRHSSRNTDSFAWCRQGEAQHLTKALSNAEELLQTLLTGLSSGTAGNTGGGYMGQLADAKARSAQASAEEEQSKVKLGMSEKELKILEARWKEVEREAGEGKRNLETMQAGIEDFKSKIKETGWSAEKDEEFEVALRNAKAQVRQLAETRDRIKERISSLNFDYASPYPNFDRSKVKGLVASLISLDPRITTNPLHWRSLQVKLQAATRLAPGKVHLALSLVGYPDEVANAMIYAFGGTLICEDAESAKLVTFSREVGVKSVTLDGDVYDPSGTLSGGSAPSGNGILIKVQELLDAEGKLGEARGRLDMLEREDERSRASREKWRKSKRELEIKEHQMQLLEEQVGGSNATRIGAEVEKVKHTIADLKGRCFETESSAAETPVVVKTQQKELQTATLEQEQLEKISKVLKRTSEASYAKAEHKLQEERATLTRFDNELKELERVIKEKKQAVSDAELQQKKLEHDLSTLGKEKTSSENFVSNLEKQYEWIADEHEQFGKPGSQYDFDAVDVNPKVINMIDTVEKKEASLKKMLELDRYKRDALEKTWTKVNGDFGGIFAELLPGNFAKLQPPEGQDLTQGLEVKVQLGSVWKQSLTELSGGQRSLIALSLIMSLLQFKPAPMYILDEIDAALDLSHTQHIGQLFRTRFKGSQFIVVSLKEGLFTNANVLFRTRFRDGTSIVERTAQRSTSALYVSGDAGNKENEANEARGSRRVR